MSGGVIRLLQTTSGSIQTTFGYAPSGSTDLYIDSNTGYPTLLSSTGTSTVLNGSVTSVSLSLPNIFTVSTPTVTTSGTLTATLTSQTANTFFAAPNGANGVPSFRSIVAADIPNLSGTNTGDVTLGPSGNSPNAQAASLIGQVLTLQQASQIFAGLMAAADKLKLDNLWYDVTNYGISQANSGAANVTAWNALYSILPVNATVYFPAGTYDFASELTLSANLQLKIKGAGRSRTILRTTSATANLFRFSIAAYYYEWEDIGFNTPATKTAGAAIQSSFDNAYMYIRSCEFKNQFIGVDWSGVGSGNVGGIYDTQFNSPAAGGYQVRINGANINTFLQNVTINITGVNTIGLEINQSGAVQVSTSDFIGGANAARINALGVVSAVFFTNVFFDQSTFGSTVKIMGTFPTSRVKFIQCGITTGAAGLAALEIAGTGTGTGIPEAIDFDQCDFYNNGFGGTTNGLLLTGVRGIDIKNSRISGFTNGVNLTPYSANGITNFNIQGCTIGPTENFSGNGVGVLINAGSFTYAASNMTNNDLSGNTTAPLQDNGTYDNNVFQVFNNIGLTNSSRAAAPNLLLATAATAVRAGNAVVILPNAPRVATSGRFTITATNAATASTQTILLKYGTANTNADANILSVALGAGTAAVGGAKIVVEWSILTTGSTGTMMATITVWNHSTIAAGTTGFTNLPSQTFVTTAPVTINTTTLNYLGAYIQPSAANVVTIRSAVIETISQ